MCSTGVEQDSTLIALDPSINSMGFAVLNSSGYVHSVGLISSRASRKHVAAITQTGLQWFTKAISASHAVQKMVAQAYRATGQQANVAIEVPEVFGTARGIGSMNNEAVQKLYACVGAIVSRLLELNTVEGIWGVKPGDWKGQTPKDILRGRVLKRLEEDNASANITNYLRTCPNDVSDALGLGYWTLGRAIYAGGICFRKPLELIVTRSDEAHTYTWVYAE